MRTVGVLGGLGPQATMDFEARVHRVAQRMIPPSANGGYPPLVVYYYRSVPFVASETGAPERPLRPTAGLLEAAAKIGGLADFLVITSNFLHVFQAEIEAAARCSVLSMIEVTLDEVTRRQWQRVGVLGFGDPVVYTQPLGRMDIAYETIDGVLRADLDAAIPKVMEGRSDADSVRAAQAGVEELRARHLDGIILGCTEIPLLLPEADGAPDLLNPLQLLAEATVSHALS